MEPKIDLHIHTWFSDGASSPTDIVKRAKEAGYDKIAITDHDGVDGLEEALEAGEQEGIHVIPGIELATETADGTELHILGYGFDRNDPHFQEILADLRKKRETRNQKLLAVLKNMGYPLSMKDLTLREGQRFVGKPIIARAMVKKGYVQKPKDAFEKGKFLESPEAKKVKKEKLNTADAIHLIRQAGGTAVLAHPIQIPDFGEPGSEAFYQKTEKLIEELKKEGLGGLECFHPDQSPEESERFARIAKKQGLRITRGSDFHGSEYK